jgi:uncharacterized protein (TIGR02271 family)
MEKRVLIQGGPVLANEERSDRSTESKYSFAGYHVYDYHYEKIGKVDDLFVDENNQPEYVGVKMGFLGTRSTLIPIEIVRINDKRKLLEVATDKDMVKEGPTFGDDREITSEFEEQVLNYYGVETRQVSSMQRGAYGAYYADATGNERVDLQPGERASGARERIGVARGDVDSEHREDKDELRVQRIEEEIKAGTREREAGGVRVRKRVRTDREQVQVPKKRQEVHVDKVPVEGREASEAEIGDDEVRVPIIEEEIVVEKRPVVKEEIRLRKEVVEDDELVEGDVRKEEVEVEDQTEYRKALRGAVGIDEIARGLPKETREKISPEERRETDRRTWEASEKGEQRHAVNTKVAKEAQKGLPIEGYDNLTVKEAKKKLNGLSESELKRVRSYEKKHKNRRTLVEQLDRKIGDAS